MQQLITLSYHIKGEEVRPKFLSAYKILDFLLHKLSNNQDYK